MLFAPDLLTDPDFLTLAAFAMLLIGPCLGSFASALAHRIPRGQSWIVSPEGKGARSFCPHCKGQLTWLDLIPIVSWLALKGRCRMCGELISPLYPALEAGATLLGFVFLFTQGLTFTFMMSLLALPFLLALFVLSWDTQKSDETLPLRIPGVLLALALMLGGGQALLSTHPAMVILDKLIGGAGFAAVGLMLARTRRGLFRERLASPSGEIGLLAVAGLWLGVSSLPVFLIGAGFYGAVAAAIRMAVHGAKPRPGQSVMLHAFIASFMVTMAFGARILALLIS